MGFFQSELHLHPHHHHLRLDPLDRERVAECLGYRRGEVLEVVVLLKTAFRVVDRVQKESDLAVELRELTAELMELPYAVRERLMAQLFQQVILEKFAVAVATAPDLAAIVPEDECLP